MIIRELIQHIETEVTGNDQVSCLHLTFDSRQVGEGSLYFAIKGTQIDGHHFIADAVSKGAMGIVCEKLPPHMDPAVVYILVKNSQEAMAHIASAFYGHPSRQLKLVAITGTNGKTTVATLLHRLFLTMGHQAGLLSTVENRINDTVIPASHTTPDAIRINELLEEMVKTGCEYCFMEASSHAIEQHRITALHFAGTVFNNITHDHLDYHLTFENYIRAKKQLFDNQNSDSFALTNKDDKNGMVMLQNTKATRYTYALKSMADFKARIIENDFNGMLLHIDGEEAWFRLIGFFNAYNLLAVYSTAFLLGKNKHEIITTLSRLESARGRFETIRSTGGITGIIDYAHTPDALKNVLETINEIRTRNEDVITIVGCGGNRDAAKRPVMADIASTLSTRVIFTSDNPRNENPEEILNEMQQGIKPLHYKKTLRITDRKEAIKAAVSSAHKGDIILLAGKGHEDYQEIAGVKHPFDDKKILMEMFNLLEK